MAGAIRLCGNAAAVVAVALLVLVGTLLCGGRTLADEMTSSSQTWIVAEITGSAFSRPGDATDAPWQTVRAGASIERGSVVRTDASGRLVLANGADRIRMSANSEIELPAASDGNGATRVIHWIGSAFFQVGKRPAPQFEVDTPYLAAIVKGTQFTTTVSGAGASVAVDEGVVGVSAAAGGASTDVAAGQSASVAAANPGTVAPGKLSDGVTNADDATGQAAVGGETAGGAHQGAGSQGGNGKGDGGGGKGGFNGHNAGGGHGNGNGGGCQGHGCGDDGAGHHQDDGDDHDDHDDNNERGDRGRDRDRRK